MINSSSSLTDKELELSDPNPDIFSLFIEYDAHFFYGKLQGVELKWSKRMTLCAGLCRYQGRAGYCSIHLSEPLLKLRPRKDLVETLLHEMIHAFLFVTRNNRDHDAHGPEFRRLMHHINKSANVNITVFHNFNEEVQHYRTHWWKCNGPCNKREPYFGIVKRATNRAPSKNDWWWRNHEMTCGGVYEKIKEPEGYKKKDKTEVSVGGGLSQRKITGFTQDVARNAQASSGLSTISHSKSVPSVGSTPVTGKCSKSKSNILKITKTSESCSIKDKEVSNLDKIRSARLKRFGAMCIDSASECKTDEHVESHQEDMQASHSSTHFNRNIYTSPPTTCICPVCGEDVVKKYINEHLDSCIQ